MRPGASVGYLLARTSDTLADTPRIPPDLRKQHLDLFAQTVARNTEPPRWPTSLRNSISDPRERHLLECSSEVIGWLNDLPEAEAHLVREVVSTIISGQKLDLERFGNADRSHVVILADHEELEDYTWRVAGCVGAFWTRLGFVTMKESFSTTAEDSLLEKGVTYGKGLQLVNILRDLPNDLDAGRCYLPVKDPDNVEDLLAAHSYWCGRAEEWIASGVDYAGMLESSRLRAATVLPAKIAQRTLVALQGATWERLQTRIKIPRSEIYRLVLKSFFQPLAKK